MNSLRPQQEGSRCAREGSGAASIRTKEPRTALKQARPVVHLKDQARGRRECGSVGGRGGAEGGAL